MTMASTFDDSARPRSLPGLGEQVIDGEAVIVNAQGGEILVLNQCGALIWQLLDGDHDVASIVSSIQDEFEVDAETAGRDVRDFLAALSERGALAG